MGAAGALGAALGSFAGKDEGKDAGKDAGRDAGKDAGKPLPDEPHCARSTLPSAAVAHIRRALMALSEPSGGRKTLLEQPVRVSAWTRGDDSRYDPVRRMLLDELEAASR